MSTGFWSDPILEPKRAFRWIVLIGNIPFFIAKKVTKPEFKVTEAKHNFINHTFYFPGRVEWQPVSLTLVDPVSPDSSRTLQNILRNSGYNLPLDPNVALTSISKARAVAALGRFSIEQLGPEGGEPVESWELVNAWIQSVKYGELDYEKDDLINLEMTIRYDFPIQTKSGVPA